MEALLEEPQAPGDTGHLIQPCRRAWQTGPRAPKGVGQQKAQGSPARDPGGLIPDDPPNAYAEAQEELKEEE